MPAAPERAPEWLQRLLEWPNPFDDPKPVEIEARELAEHARRRARTDEVFRKALAELLKSENLVVECRLWTKHIENRRLPMPLEYA